MPKKPKPRPEEEHTCQTASTSCAQRAAKKAAKKQAIKKQTAKGTKALRGRLNAAKKAAKVKRKSPAKKKAKPKPAPNLSDETHVSPALKWDPKDPDSWKPLFLQAYEIEMSVGLACRIAGISTSTYRRAMDEDEDFWDAVQDLNALTVESLKSRALKISLGKEDEIRFVGKEGRKEIVKKDGQVTLRWMLEALEPQIFNQKAIEAKRSDDVTDPIVLMPEIEEDAEALEVTHEIEEESA